MNRYICIHGHFYQPPRENPWLEKVELQDSAYPYHDWNSRTTAECYAPNTASRILDPERRIIDIVNNYSKISFNFGPTLLSWLEKNQPEIYQAILEADKKSRELFSGHGSAMAQAYNHMIMPLAKSRDKRTQVIWGIKDFENRFKRKPEGMWLPETAVDLETLDIMAEYGITSTILAPRQAQKIRKLGEKKWLDLSDEKIDPKKPYLCKLPSGRTIAIFFYDGPISQELAFGNLLEWGENFAHRLVSAFTETDEPQLVHIATDGETYGHHHRLGDMALAHGLYYLEANNLARITVYGDYLEKFPPTQEVEIFENSSWSCIHGVERWKSNCGCNSGMHQGWSQAWRAPLRGAMDWLRDNLALIYEEQMTKFVDDPGKVRDNYIEVILNWSSDNIERFLSEQVKKELSSEDKTTMMKLLEMERHAMLLYTSCGWFFDEISGIETVQIMQYAARAMQLAKDISKMPLEDIYITLLEKAPSNLAEFKHGGKIYEQFVKPSILDLLRVGVHYGVSSLFRDYPESIDIYTYQVKNQMYDRVEMGRQKLAVGKALVQSTITGEKDLISFAVLHLGDQNLIAGARVYMGEEAFSEMYQEIKERFLKGEISEVILAIDKHFKTHSYSLWHLFRDEQREILNQIFNSTLKEVENSFRQICDHHYSLMQAVEGLNLPLPRYFPPILEFVINTDIYNLLESGELNSARLQKMVDEVKRWSLELDRPKLSLLATQKINGLMENFSGSPENITLMEEIINFLKTLDRLSLDLNLWQPQNLYFSLGKHWLDQKKEKAEKGQEDSKRWIENFITLGDYLRVRIE
ncbi:MAG: DUF3536 domain-containing protein [Pseudomonadota bacterium]